MKQTASRPVLVALVAALALAAGDAAAQVGEAGQVELGAFGSVTRFDQTNLGLANQFGGGGRLAYFITRFLSLEGSGDHVLTDSGSVVSRVKISRVSGSLIYHLRAGFNAFYLGAGYERAFYRGSLEGEQNGFVVTLGDRLPLGGRAAFRVEGRASFYSSSDLSGSSLSATNLGATAGISIFTFGGPPRDQDIDGVTDRGDRCPDTPAGAVVDPAGCPSDGDRDGYLNGLDQCPDTPAGASVDGQGCPSDTDGDSVYDGIDVCPATPTGAAVDDSGCSDDGDDDGVLDGLDQCPDTPGGASVDDDGCPSDQDSDGVFDGLDQCPDTPAGAEVDSQGCAIDRDQDDDGVLNTLDRCPDTPAGLTVDQNGCPVELDDDGDGVPNARDRCPGTRPGQQVDNVGCTVLFRIEEGVRRPLILRGVNFASGRSNLTAASYATLDEVAASLVANPEVRIEIAGHTDATGSRQTNMELSLARAMAVRAYLAQKGVVPERMVARGYGPDQPVATNATRAGRAQNRRVELEIVDRQNP